MNVRTCGRAAGVLFVLAALLVVGCVSGRCGTTKPGPSGPVADGSQLSPVSLQRIAELATESLRAADARNALPGISEHQYKVTITPGESRSLVRSPAARADALRVRHLILESLARSQGDASRFDVSFEPYDPNPERVLGMPEVERLNPDCTYELKVDPEVRGIDSRQVFSIYLRQITNRTEIHLGDFYADGLDW